MATGSENAKDWDAMSTGDDAPLRLGAVGCTLTGPIRPCNYLLMMLFPGDRNEGRDAVKCAVKRLSAMVGTERVTDYKAIRAELQTWLSDNGHRDVSPIVIAILMVLLETSMSAEELQVSVGYMDALMRVSVVHNEWETFMTPYERMLLAVCGAGSHDPREDWTRQWVSGVLSRQVDLMKDWTETERASVAREIEEIVPKAWARMALYPPEHYRHGIRPYQCARP